MNEITRISGTGKNAVVSSTAVTDAPAPDKRDLVELLNQGYVCPPDSGPAWRAACDAGVDMGLVEDALLMHPVERLREHQRALNQVLTMVHARSTNDPGN